MALSTLVMIGETREWLPELAERAKYSLTLEQLYWRRWAIDSKCEGSADLFRQEYPGCPEEAFLGSGRPRFSHEALGLAGHLLQLQLTVGLLAFALGRTHEGARLAAAACADPAASAGFHELRAA